MIVMKFGGTSVGSPERIDAVIQLIKDSTPKIVVLSAMSGTTNSLVNIADLLYKKDQKAAQLAITELAEKYDQVIANLYKTAAYQEKAKQLVKSHFDHIRSFCIDVFTVAEERTILAQGELISTALVHFYASELGINTVLLPALNFMRTDRNSEPDTYYIKEQLRRELANHPDCNLFITQGYICRNAFGEIDNLKRGGSDYSASLIGQGAAVDEIQIWTDIDGFHNNDPRVVQNTKAISYLTFDEAAELAYFGAKILHPTCVWPAREANIPLRLKNTMDPSSEGTFISGAASAEGVKSIAAKDNITAIKIKSGRMLMAYGFLRKVFEVFESYQTPIDMITTSEIAVSLTIDDVTHLDKIAYELRHYGEVQVDRDMVIICLVGYNLMNQKAAIAKIFTSLDNIPIRMVSYGGSRHNISILVDQKDKNEALKQLSRDLFN